MEKTYSQKLDVYYISSITYLVVLVIYAVIAGTMVGDRIQMVWDDPIIYLLALCVVVSLGGLIVAGVLCKRVIIRDSELVFATRFKKRIIRPDEIVWIAVRRGSRGKVRDGIAERAARIRLKGTRRRLWVRPSGFTDGEQMMKELIRWANHNGVQLRVRRRRSPLTGGQQDSDGDD